MPIFVAYQTRKMLHRISKFGLVWPLIVIILLGVVAYPFMILFESKDNDMLTPSNFIWFTHVSFTTIGYGDYTPKTNGGRLTAILMTWIGIACGAVELTNIGQAVSRRAKRMNQGLHSLENSLKEHAVIIGFHATRTPQIINELRSENGNLAVIICARQVDVGEHPLAGMPRVEFISGDPELADTLHRAAVVSARFVIVDTGDDRFTRGVIDVIRTVSKTVHVVAVLAEMAERVKIQQVCHDDSEIECVHLGQVGMVARAALEPGTAEFIEDLTSTRSGTGGIYVATVPPGVSYPFGHLSAALLARYRVNVMSLQVVTNDGREQRFGIGPDFSVTPGMQLIYAGCNRVDIDWALLSSRQTSRS